MAVRKAREIRKEKQEEDRVLPWREGGKGKVDGEKRVGGRVVVGKSKEGGREGVGRDEGSGRGEGRDGRVALSGRWCRWEKVEYAGGGQSFFYASHFPLAIPLGREGGGRGRGRRRRKRRGERGKRKKIGVVQI